MRFVLLAASAAALTAGAPAAAQQSDVNSYLCTFAGKCGGTSTAEETVTKDAPTTKGFRLAQSASTPAPTKAVPETRGFRLAAAPGAAQPSAASTNARAPRSARPMALAQPARASLARRTAGYAAGRGPTPAPGIARANLMLAFDYNSSAMTPAAEAKARSFAEALKMDELKDKRFLIEGHTDARGARDVNVDLSRRRAQSVADFLVAQGVDRTRVEVKGVGPDEPLPGRGPKAEENRRVEAVLLS